MTTGKTILTTPEIAARFHELAQQEMWFEIQDELFAEHVRSIEPPHSPYFGDAEGKIAVRQKGQNWVERVEAVHRLQTTQPVVGGRHFAVYEVQDGQIVLEQFFY